MILGITGGTGFIGSCIREEAERLKHQVILFSRYPDHDVESRIFSTRAIPDITGCEAFIHLAGESIIGLWTDKKREKILKSRREGTRRLVEAIAQAPVKPRVLVSASAIGYYGDTGDTIVDESSPAGSDFLAEVAQVWEGEAMQAEQYGVRVVLLRTGLVLARHGGFLQKLKPFFRLGFGGKLGSGDQWMSFIEIHDFMRLTLHCCQDDSVRGPINVVMPHSVTNGEFTQVLAETVKRPALFDLPEFFLRFMLGDFSSLFLNSQRVAPTKAQQLGYEFQYPDIRKALEEVIG